MNVSAKALVRHVAVVMLLTVLALLRAEQGVAELQGSAGEPRRLLSVAPQPDGAAWNLQVLGHEARLPSWNSLPAFADTAEEWRRRVEEQLERMRESFPK